MRETTGKRQRKRRQTGKREEKNKFHKEYGIPGNALYMLKKVAQYCPKLFPLCITGIIAGALVQVLASFVGKYVIDMVERQKAVGDIYPLLKLLLVVAFVSILICGLNTLSNNKRMHYFICVRMDMITERVAKALCMNYESLEKPDMLDMHQKAKQSCESNDNGVEGLLRNLYDMMANIVLLLLTLSVVLVLDWRLLLIIAGIAFLQYLFFRYTVKKDRREVWEKLAPTWRRIAYMERTTQDFDYAKDIRLFGMQDWLSRKQHEVLMEKQSKMLYSRNLWINNSIFAHCGSMVSTLVIYVILILAFLRGNMTIGNFTLYLGLASTFTATLTEFFNCCGRVKQCSLQVDDFRSFMAIEEEDESSCIPVPKADGYTFVFRNVSFKYEGADTYALRNLNLTMEAGKRLAVVGLNGAGKTTFIKLLLRLYDVTEGEILCNGINIKNFRRAEYYRLFAPVFQNVELFAFPMSENVSMKTPQETDKEFAAQCLVQAGMEEKMNRLKDGVDTQILKVLYDDGVDLSGGERQKLALARVLYKKAPVIVLDEPTAALDALAEYRLYKNFDTVIGDKTAVYISHRLSSTRFCDTIAMFKDGEMVEYGSHEALLAKDGDYAEMFAVQAQYYKEGEELCHAQ